MNSNEFKSSLESTLCDCGGKLLVNIGYSCPITYICKCKICGNIFYHYDPNEEGLTILEGDDAIKKRSELYINDPDDKLEKD